MPSKETQQAIIDAAKRERERDNPRPKTEGKGYPGPPPNRRDMLVGVIVAGFALGGALWDGDWSRMDIPFYFAAGAGVNLVWYALWGGR